MRFFALFSDVNKEYYANHVDYELDRVRKSNGLYLYIGMFVTKRKLSLLGYLNILIYSNTYKMYIIVILLLPKQFFLIHI